LNGFVMPDNIRKTIIGLYRRPVSDNWISAVPLPLKGAGV
jgi:hypothetical protein